MNPETSKAPPEEKSDLVRAVEARARKQWTFEANSFVKESNPLGKFRVRILTVQEQSAAQLQAQEHMKKEAGDSDLKHDKDYCENIKAAFALHMACRDAEKDRPAFPSGKWLLEHFSADELGVLFNHYCECLKLGGPMDLDLSDEKIELLADLCSKNADNDYPNLALNVFTREQIAEIAIRLAIKLQGVRAGQPAASTEVH